MINTLLGIGIFLLIILNFIYHYDCRYGRRKLERLKAGDIIQDGSRLLRVVAIPMQELKEDLPKVNLIDPYEELDRLAVLGRARALNNIESTRYNQLTRLQARIY